MLAVTALAMHRPEVAQLMVARKMSALELPPVMLVNDPATVFAGVPKLPPSASAALSVAAVPPAQLCPTPGVVTVPLTRIDAGTKVVFVGTRSEILIFVAVAPPDALATEMQYSTTAPGIVLKLLALTPSLITRLLLNTLSTAAETVKLSVATSMPSRAADAPPTPVLTVSANTVSTVVAPLAVASPTAVIAAPLLSSAVAVI